MPSFTVRLITSFVHRSLEDFFSFFFGAGHLQSF